MSQTPKTAAKRTPRSVPRAGGRSAVDPATRLPADARPTSVVWGAAALHGTVALLAGIALVATSYRDVGSGILVWGIAWVLVVLPVSALVARCAWEWECVVSGAGPNPLPWHALALSTLSAAHWLPLCLWSPALAAGILLQPSRAEELLGGVFVAVAPWIATTAGLTGAMWANRRLGSRSWADLAPAPKHAVPFTLVAAAAAAGLAVMPSVLWLEWVERTAWDRAGLWSAWVWLLVGLGLAAVAGGVVGRFLEPAARIVPRLAVGHQGRQLEIAATVFTVHWVVLFGLLILRLPLDDPDPRHSFLLCAVAAVTIGVGAISVGRELRRSSAHAVP